ncbi:MAG: hypothetical protein ABIY62_00185 [Ginsengibacter sp.]
MKLKNKTKNIIGWLGKLLFVISFFSFINIKNIPRNIHLAGLVVDANTLEPVKSANIYSSTNQLLGTTNNNGYYDISFKANDYGQIEFTIRINKTKYKTFVDKERWGDLQGQISFILYFGISPINSDIGTFSTFPNEKIQGENLSFESVMKSFEDIKSEKKFDDQLSALKKGNENSFFKNSNQSYIVSNSGWIKIKSDTENISVDNIKVIPANELNSSIKRSDIKGMTPVESNEATVLINTK